VKKNNRETGVDGLRGFAAIVVLLHHTFMTIPWIADAYVNKGRSMNGGLILETIYYSPLHIIVSGTEAVMLFFMLSGFVLYKAYPGRSSLKFSYLAPRLTRLYLPIWGSLLLALALTQVQQSSSHDPLSWWTRAHLENPFNIISDLFVIPGTDWLNSSLWSMQIEIIVSIILAVVVWVADKKVMGFLAILAISIVAGNAPWVGPVLHYLPYFVAGALIAQLDLKIRGRFAVLLPWLGVAFFTAPWVSRYFSLDISSGIVGDLSIFAGSVAFTLSSLTETPFSRSLKNALGSYLGTRSYSIYLVHAPVVVLISLWYVSWRGSMDSWLYFVPLVLAIVLVVSEVFYRIVEKPSHQFSRKFRRALLKQNL
jgi:peptidoglycan/LPS O-acetylase OafA/YrhL